MNDTSSDSRQQAAIIKRILRLKAYMAHKIGGCPNCRESDLNRLKPSTLILAEKALKAEARDVSATGSTKKTWVTERSGQ